MVSFEAIRFDDRFVRELPGDADQRNKPRQVEAACYSLVTPQKFLHPKMIAYSTDVAASLGFTAAMLESPDFTAVFSGSIQAQGMQPYAMCYGGHQFGHWAGQLGDGRAINLGELVSPTGAYATLQLKGAGPTPYSRRGDGFAVLRSSVREFLCSEAMHHLGVPSTRALSVALTGEMVVRDMFYDGHPKAELGAVVCRVAPSFLRFGNFEIFSARNDVATLRKLVDFSVHSYFADCVETGPQMDVQWFAEVCRRTARMIAHWQRVGFVHGVMNTDNMSIHGLTIDYGPYGWLDNYDPNWTPNTTDAAHRRYRFGQQADVALWNLAQLANALYPLVQAVEPLEEALEEYRVILAQEQEHIFAQKLGLQRFLPALDRLLQTDLEVLLVQRETDMTIFYRTLATVQASIHEHDVHRLLEVFADAFYQPEQENALYIRAFQDWFARYFQRLRGDAGDDSLRRATMNAVNPKYVLRNYLAQLAIDQAEQHDYTLLHELLELLRHPYAEQPAMECYATRRPDWAKDRAGCSMLSCSS